MRPNTLIFPLLLPILPLTLAQTSHLPQIARPCGPSSSNIICISHYSSVLPYPFYRNASTGGTPSSYGSTSVPSDPSFALISSANFIVFDEEKAFEILGESPRYEYVFEVSDAVHEAPVYSPATNKLYFSQLVGPNSPPGFLPQLVIDLNVEPPVFGELLSDPPIYAPNGGTIYNGLIYWGVSGGNNSIGGIASRPGIATLDPLTNKTEILLNNYFGYYFNTVDDLAVDSKGDIWFTDPQYTWFNGLSNIAPQLQTASYRFRPSTGSVSVVDDSIVQPNGIAFSPSTSNRTTKRGQTVYISDSGAASGTILQSLGTPANLPFNTTGKRTIYAYDLTEDGNHIVNKRAIYLAQEGVPDGLKVARNGYVVTGTGMGVDVIDPNEGTLILRIQTNYTVQNFAWTGTDYQDFWLMGQGGVSRVQWNLQGRVLK